MKKQTLQIILGFFLIFSAFSARADFTVPYQSGFQSACASGCYGSKTALCAACNGYVYTNNNYCSVPPTPPQTSRPNIQIYSCSTYQNKPLNSTCTGTTCTCDQGYRENSSLGLISTTYSCTVPYAEPSDEILAYAIGAGLFAGGTAAGLASCSFGPTPTCVASAVSALAGAGLALSTYLSSSDTSPVAASPDPCAGKTCITVQIDPNKPITGAQSYISRDSSGNLKPEGSGWTNNGDGKHTIPVTDGLVTVDTVSDRITSSIENSTGSYTSTVQSGNYAGGLEFAVQGIDGNTSSIKQFTGSFNNQGVQLNQKQSSNAGTTAGNFNGAISGGTGTGGTGTGTGGTGTGTGSGGGDCQTYGCAKETTQQQVLDSLKGGGNIDHAAQGQAASDSVSAGLESLISDYQGQVQNQVDEILNDSTVKDLFDQLGDFNPLNASSSNCVIESNLFGKQLNLSYCEEQPTIHLILSFIFFVWFVFAVTNLILERNH